MDDPLEELHIADYMVYIVLQMFDDKKIFIGAVSHLRNALFLTLKRLYNSDSDEFVLEKLKLDNKFERYFDMVSNINDFYKKLKGQSIKIKRKDKYIVIGEDYKVSSMTIEQLRKYISLAKEFIKNALQKDY